jgi:copper chaperone CopZ
MRQLWVPALAAVAVLGLASSVRAGKVEVKGLHLCCPQCEKAAMMILGKVKGVSEAEADRDNGTVTFTAKDSKAAVAGLQALVAGGFYGAATEDGTKAFKPAEKDLPKKGDKADTIVIKGVHACCKRCEKAITKVFDGKEVEFANKKGPQQDVKISGKGLDKAEILEALRKAGFNGTVTK